MEDKEMVRVVHNEEDEEEEEEEEEGRGHT